MTGQVGPAKWPPLMKVAWRELDKASDDGLTAPELTKRINVWPMSRPEVQQDEVAFALGYLYALDYITSSPEVYVTHGRDVSITPSREATTRRCGQSWYKVWFPAKQVPVGGLDEGDGP